MDAASFERLRQPSGIPRLLCGLLRPQAVAGSQRATFRRCWCRTSSGATPRISRNRWSISATPRAMQRFLTEARCSAVIGLQEYLAPRLGHRLPQAGQEIGGSGPGGRFTARVGCSWPTSARWAGRWWTSGCICPRVGPQLPTSARTGVLRRVCRRTGGSCQMVPQPTSAGVVAHAWRLTGLEQFAQLVSRSCGLAPSQAPLAA